MGTKLIKTSEAILLCGAPSVRQVKPSQIQSLRDDGYHVMAVNFRAVEAGHPIDSQVTADSTWFPEDRQPRPWVNEYIAKWSPGIMLDTSIEIWRRYQFRLAHAWLDSEMTLEELPNVQFYRGVLTLAGTDPGDFLGDPHVWIGEMPSKTVKVTCRCSMLPAFKILWDKGIRRIYLVGCEFHDPERAKYWERLAGILGRLNRQFEDHGLEVLNTVRYSGCGVFPYADLPG